MIKSAEKKGFPALFWLANVMELFERGAYYGMNSVLAVYLTASVREGGLGFAEESVGFLQAIVYALTYIVPILGGALAEKMGYRRMLIVAFSFLTAGYFAAGYSSSYALVFLSLLVMATGSGLFNPIISGTIARSTTEENSGLGFGIYYWMINLGAFFAPLIVSVLKGFSWKYVFMASSLWCFLMLIPSLFLYKDPVLPGKGRSLKETASNALIVLRDSRFMLMVFIYSFFWILYFQNFGTVLWFLRDLVDKEPVNRLVNGFLQSLGLGWKFNFGAEHVTVINAATIILLQVLVSRIVKNMRPLPVMSSGIIFGALGFSLLAIAKTPWIFIAGIVVFSVGEMTAHPKYYSYIGRVAPDDKKAIYMGYAFLYGVIGSLFGSSLGAILYVKMVKNGGKPALFFGLFAFLGFICCLLLTLFDRFFSQDSSETRKRAKSIMSVLYSLLTLAGGALMVDNLFLSPVPNYKVLFQAIILLLVGAGGLYLTFSRKNVQT